MQLYPHWNARDKETYFSFSKMGGGGKQPTEETIVDNTNVGLVNLSNTGMTYFGVGEILTVLILILVLAIIGNYCFKRRRRARMVELEQSIRNAANPGVYRSPMQVAAQPQAGQGFFQNLPTAPQAIPMVTFSSPGTREVHYKTEPNMPRYWESCK